MHLESDFFKRYFSNHFATWAFFFPTHFLISGFPSKFRQEDGSDEERPLYWDFSSSSASCWPMWPWTERENWRWRWPHWLFLIQTSSGILSPALSISFEGDINKQECTQVAGRGQEWRAGQDAEKLGSACLLLQIPSCHCKVNCTQKLFVFSVL